MKYASTRGKSAPVDFETAVMTGLASDGGLFLPDRIPDARGKLAGWAALTYPQLAGEVTVRVALDGQAAAEREAQLAAS